MAGSVPESGVVIVIDLNKCIGCNACAMACKTWWTLNEDGAEHAWWNIVETRPGPGYPRDWLEKSMRGEGQEKRTMSPRLALHTRTCWIIRARRPRRSSCRNQYLIGGPNWDWDKGVGEKPEDAWFFYLPIQCMYCDDAPCVESCPTHALYKREDGIVMFDPQLCMGCQTCFNVCPYRRVFWNYKTATPSKCIMCAPLIDKGEDPICVRACPTRARYFGRLEDTESPVHVLVKEYGVALPLLPQFNTSPRVLYVPPVLTPPRPDGEPRYDERYLEDMFGENVWGVKEVLEKERRRGEDSKLIRVLTGYYYGGGEEIE